MTVLPAAVLFDMDGLLVDSEPIWLEIEQELMSGFGVDWTEDQAASLVGNPLPVSAEILIEAAGVEANAHELAQAMVDRMVVLLRRSVLWKPGAVELAAALRRAGVPVALVSSSYRRLVDAVLGHLPEGTFDVSVAGDEVRRPKPSPEPYLTAAARLGVDPRLCVVLEDSPTGIAAGEAAGAHVVAVPDQHPVAPRPGRSVLPTLEGVTPADLGRLMVDDPSA